MNFPKEGDRVLHAAQLYQTQLEHKMVATDITPSTFEVFLRAFKEEQDLEVWIKNKTATEWQLFIQYPFCAFSGQLGPKRKEGDLQIPEGFYHIDRYNPRSNFYLSLGLNYPNNSDRILGYPQKPGSDIFIHGGCATVGCIPITDEKIAELYTLTSMAHRQGQQKIPVHFFPYKMSNQKFTEMSNQYPAHRSFWLQLKDIYDYFESNKNLPIIEIDAQGNYLIVH